jgi:hypothetical protein
MLDRAIRGSSSSQTENNAKDLDEVKKGDHIKRGETGSDAKCVVTSSE